MVQVNDFLRPLMLKDLRTQCRARGLNPGGSRESLAERVGEHMLATQDFTIFSEAALAPGGGAPGSSGNRAHTSLASADEAAHSNNYSRPNGQNVGNHITDRPSSRVLAPPGGASQVTFGGYDTSPRQEAAALADVSNQDYSRGHEAVPAAKAQPEPAAAAPASPEQGGFYSGHGMSREGGAALNNYSRPNGQNVGNFLGDRPSSRVAQPPGGASQVFFG